MEKEKKKSPRLHRVSHFPISAPQSRISRSFLKRVLKRGKPGWLLASPETMRDFCFHTEKRERGGVFNVDADTPRYIYTYIYIYRVLYLDNLSRYSIQTASDIPEFCPALRYA